MKKPQRKIKQPVEPRRNQLKEKLDQWCQKQHRWIMAAIIVVSLVFRVLYYQQLGETHFINETANVESDMSFFHEGAVKIANGDLLSRTVGHPRHKWMEWVADRHFKDHPEKLEEFKAKIGTDTLAKNPVSMLWDQWYGEKTFQQEPLYPYFVALSYTLFGENVRWVFILQLFFGILTNLLIYLVARRYFGYLAATIAAFLAVFFGPMLFYEMVLLRSSLAVFLGILLVYVTGTAILKNNVVWWIITGIIAGLAIMVHSFFLFFILGTTVALLFIYRKSAKTGLTFSAGLLAGLFLTISPVMIRNITVGAPAMSLSSTATLSFVTMNNSDFKSFIGWNINIQYLSNILGESNGKLMKAIVPALKTHKSPKSYFLMVWNKLHATFSWYEIPNNVNFYLYREYIPVLFLTFISFFLIVPLALTGIFLTIYKKINAWPLLLMFLVYMFPMIAFMVLSRYRIVLVPVLIPFAALTVAELLSTWKGWKNYLIVLAVLGLGYWSSTTGNKPVSELSRNDYSGIWTAYYADKVKKEIEQNQIREVASGLQDYFDRYQPKTISEVPPAYRCKDLYESDVFLYFSEMHSRFVNVYLNLRDSTNARKQKEISENLKMVASRPVRDP